MNTPVRQTGRPVAPWRRSGEAKVLAALVVGCLCICAPHGLYADEPLPLDVPGGFASTHIVVELQPGHTIRRTSGSVTMTQMNTRWNAAVYRQAFPPPYKDPELAAELGLDRFYIVEVPADTDTPLMAEDYAKVYNIKAVHLDPVGGAAIMPNDVHFHLQWNLNNESPVPSKFDSDIDGPGAWDIYTGGDNEVIVAVLDSGVDPHMEFADRLLPGKNTSDPATPNLTTDGCPHGTHVAGIIAAAGNNGIGVAGMNWNVKILPVRILNGCLGTELQAAQGIMWAVNEGNADIINMSVQYYEGSLPLQSAVKYATGAGALVVAAAGNDQGPTVAYPAAFDEAMAVSATNDRDLLASFSNYGPEVDVAAPGQDIWSTWVGNSYHIRSGTSMAAPHVSGLTSLLLSYDPTLTVDELRDIITSTADDLGVCGWDRRFGHGRINAYRALLNVTQLEPPGIVASSMRECLIDARQPSEVDGSDLLGIDMVELTFDGNVASLTPADFSVKSKGSANNPPAVVDVIPVGGNSVEVYLSGPVQMKTWTTITHESTGTNIRIGYLPGDVNEDGIADTLDVLAVIDSLIGIGRPLPNWATDVNRSGKTNAQDILRVIDLLNGAGAFESFNHVSLP